MQKFTVDPSTVQVVMTGKTALGSGGMPETGAYNVTCTVKDLKQKSNGDYTLWLTLTINDGQFANSTIFEYLPIPAGSALTRTTQRGGAVSDFFERMVKKCLLGLNWDEEQVTGLTGNAYTAAHIIDWVDGRTGQIFFHRPDRDRDLKAQTDWITPDQYLAAQRSEFVTDDRRQGGAVRSTVSPVFTSAPSMTMQAAPSAPVGLSAVAPSMAGPVTPQPVGDAAATVGMLLGASTGTLPTLPTLEA
jgi:hypothetical protein